jgi:hypothetical protein
MDTDKPTTEGKSCCICLDYPTSTNPIQLLACGCKCSWFHLPCEYEWLDSIQQFPITCPTCRRIVPVDTTYSFSYDVGEDQKALWHVGAAIAAEASLMLLTQDAYILPFQSLSILFIPFVVPSSRTLAFFTTQLKIKYIFQGIIAAIWLNDAKALMPSIIFCGYWYTFVLHMFVYILYKKEKRLCDPLESFAISRSIRHAVL